MALLVPRPDIPRSISLPPLLIEKELDMGAAPLAPSPESIDEQDPLRIFVFDTQRTSSQLFNRQLLSHLHFGSISNPYALAATLGPERIQPKLQNNERAKRIWEEQVASAPHTVSSLTYMGATVKFLTEADRLEQQGKILFVREHAPLVMKHDVILSAIHSNDITVSKTTNPTCMPDELLKAVTPIIFIRHPARVIPAWLREANSSKGCYNVDDDDLTLWTSARWSRIIFDYLRGSGQYKRPTLQRTATGDAAPLPQRPTELPVVASRPFVIDAADVVHNTHAILSTLCRLLGLDVQAIQGNWSPDTKFQRASKLVRKTIPTNLMKAFTDRLASSQRVSRSEYDIDLDTEQRAWTKEFGQDVAQALRRKVEEELPHYNYLKNFKLSVRPTVSEVTFKENVFGVPLTPRFSFDGTANSIWQEGERTSHSAMTEICRSSSLGELPVGIMS